MTASADDRRPDEPPLPDEEPIELRALVDDAGTPSRLTVYPADADGEELVTAWITVEVDAAVPLSEVR